MILVTSCLLYSDDIILNAMRIMLDICDKFAAEFDIKFNSSKFMCCTCCVFFTLSQLLLINFKKTKVWFLGCEAASLVVLEQEVAQVKDFCYLGSMISSPLDDLRRRRGMAWSVFWKLETVWRSQSLNLETKLSLFDSLVLSVMLYGAETWPISTQMNQLINSFATSACRIMTGVKRLDKVRNTMVLRSVSRNDLIHTVHDRQLRFLGHMLRNTHSTHASTYALYQPTHGTTRRDRPRLNYMDYTSRS